jgi:hypothetical protein
VFYSWWRRKWAYIVIHRRPSRQLFVSRSNSSSDLIPQCACIYLISSTYYIHFYTCPATSLLLFLMNVFQVSPVVIPMPLDWIRSCLTLVGCSEKYCAYRYYNCCFWHSSFFTSVQFTNATENSSILTKTKYEMRWEKWNKGNEKKRLTKYTSSYRYYRMPAKQRKIRIKFVKLW